MLGCYVLPESEGQEESRKEETTAVNMHGNSSTTGTEKPCYLSKSPPTKQRNFHCNVSIFNWPWFPLSLSLANIILVVMDFELKEIKT